MADNELMRVIKDDEARVNVTWKNQNGDLPDPVFRDAAEGDVKGWVTEAVRNGGVPGIAADRDANFADYVVDRFPPTEARPYNLIQVRPKTAFGVEVDDEDNGPSDQEIEDQEIDRRIEAQEEAAIEQRAEDQEIDRQIEAQETAAIEHE